VSLNLLKGFEAAARHLSFTRAAHELSLTQSAVSREVKTLEEQLGQRLFNRASRGLRLTDAGQALCRAVGEALTLIDNATDRLARSGGGETLSITTSVPLASVWLAPTLLRFTSTHPTVDVRSVATNDSLDLDRERIDVAIRWAPPGSSVLGGEPLFDVKMFPICSPALARDRKRPLRRPADLARHVMLDLDFTGTRGPWSDWKPWLEAMKLGDLKPAGVLRFSHYDHVVQAAINGSGVAIGRTPHNARHLREHLLVAPFGREAVLGWGTYYVVTAPRSAERPLVREFVAMLQDEARKDTGLQQVAPAQPVAPTRTRHR
jgi:DNA-binding transcriptional LysR family regulator